MVNRTPKRQAKQEASPQYNDYFEAMKTGKSEVTPPENKGPDVAEQLQALMARVDALTEQNAALRNYQPPAPQVVYAQPPEQQQEEQIPDPVLDSAGYTNWLLQRVGALTQTQLEQYQQEQTEKNNSADAYDRLYSGFLAVEGNDIWEQYPERVQVAAMKVSKNLSSHGIDPQAYMFQNTDRFYSDVTKMLEQDFGKPIVKDEDEDDGEVDRTAGLAGAQPAPIAKPAGDGNRAIPDLNADLTAIQRKGGWY